MTVGKSSKEWKISFKKTYILIYYLFIWLAALSCGTQDLVPGPPALEESSLRDHRGSPRRKTFLTFCVISALVWGQKTQGKRKILLKSSGMCLPGQPAEGALSNTDCPPRPPAPPPSQWIHVAEDPGDAWPGCTSAGRASLGKALSSLHPVLLAAAPSYPAPCDRSSPSSIPSPLW